MEEIKEMDDILNQIDLMAHHNKPKEEKPLIIIDASNIAMRHGKN